MIIRFVDIDVIVDHHCLSLLVIVEYLPVVKNLEKYVSLRSSYCYLELLGLFRILKSKVVKVNDQKLISLEVDMPEGIHINGVKLAVNDLNH